VHENKKKGHVLSLSILYFYIFLIHLWLFLISYQLGHYICLYPGRLRPYRLDDAYATVTCYYNDGTEWTPGNRFSNSAVTI
jgi:hypothetical protein